MVKQTVINARLAQALALARHKDAIVLCDGNMPIPEGCNVVDVSLVRGVPTLLQTLKAILNDLVAERYQVFELMPQYNPEMYQAIQGCGAHRRYGQLLHHGAVLRLRHGKVREAV